MLEDPLFPSRPPSVRRDRLFPTWTSNLPYSSSLVGTANPASANAFIILSLLFLNIVTFLLCPTPIPPISSPASLSDHSSSPSDEILFVFVFNAEADEVEGPFCNIRTVSSIDEILARSTSTRCSALLIRVSICGARVVERVAKWEWIVVCGKTRNRYESARSSTIPRDLCPFGCWGVRHCRKVWEAYVFVAQYLGQTGQITDSGLQSPQRRCEALYTIVRSGYTVFQVIKIRRRRDRLRPNGFSGYAVGCRSRHCL